MKKNCIILLCAWFKVVYSSKQSKQKQNGELGGRRERNVYGILGIVFIRSSFG